MDEATLLGDSGERRLAMDPDMEAVPVGVIAPRRCSPGMDAPCASKGLLRSSEEGVTEGEYLRAMGMVGAPAWVLVLGLELRLLCVGLVLLGAEL